MSTNDNLIQNNERRAAFASRGAPIPHLVARVTSDKRIATALIADFFDEFLRSRGRLEPEGLPSALKIEIQKISERTENFRNEALEGGKRPLSSLGVIAFMNLEKGLAQIARDVATALLLEAKNENFDEFQFWREFFLGMADADPSGVVIQAARLVFFDHEDDFRKAFRLDAALTGATARH